MTYSEVKEMIQALHTYGWFKLKGIPYYRKIWYKGGVQYGQAITVEGMAQAVLRPERLLELLDQRAEYELNRVIRKEGETNG